MRILLKMLHLVFFVVLLGSCVSSAVHNYGGHSHMESQEYHSDSFPDFLVFHESLTSCERLLYLDSVLMYKFASGNRPYGWCDSSCDYTYYIVLHMEVTTGYSASYTVRSDVIIEYDTVDITDDMNNWRDILDCSNM